MEIPEDYYCEDEKHVWEEKDNKHCVCLKCGLIIRKRDKIYNTYCQDERLELIKSLSGVENILKQPPPERLYSNKDYVVFKRSNWNGWCQRLRKEIKKIRKEKLTSGGVDEV